MEQRQQAGEVQQGVKQEQQTAAAPGGTAARAFYGSGAVPRPAAGAAAAAAAAGPSRPPAACQQLWVEKWRPKTTTELVGNNVRAGCNCWAGLALAGWACAPQGGRPKLPVDWHASSAINKHCCSPCCLPTCPTAPRLQSLVALLKHWLGSWEDVHLHGAAPTVPPSYRWGRGQVGLHACMHARMHWRS